MFSEGKRILGSSVDALYYSFLSSMVETYEQILTAIELEVIEVEKKLNIIHLKMFLNILIYYQDKSLFFADTFGMQDTL